MAKEVNISQKFIDEKPNLQELYNSWFKTLNYSKSTIYTYQSGMKYFLKYLSKKVEFTFSVEEFKKYRYYLQSKEKMTTNTTIVYLTIAKNFASYLYKSGYLLYSPVKELKTLKSKKIEYSFVDEDVLSRIDIANDIDLRRFVAFLLLYFTALPFDIIITLTKDELVEYRQKMYFEINGVKHYLPKEYNPVLRRYLVQYSHTPYLFYSISKQNKHEKLSQYGLRMLLLDFVKIYNDNSNNPLKLLNIVHSAMARAINNKLPKKHILKLFKIKELSFDRMYEAYKK